MAVIANPETIRSALSPWLGTNREVMRACLDLNGGIRQRCP
jgi:hypothetical protein